MRRKLEKIVRVHYRRKTNTRPIPVAKKKRLRNKYLEPVKVEGAEGMSFDDIMRVLLNKPPQTV